MIPNFVRFGVFCLLDGLLLWSASAVDCFGVNGLAYPDNVICPGSNACCGSAASCLPNRLCHNPGQNNDTFVRGPCALNPYDPNSCAEICLYNETAASQGFLPRVTVCDDGSLCCDAFPNCCESNAGVFIDSTGDIIATPLSSSTSSTPVASSSTSIPTSSTSLFSSTSEISSPVTTTSLPNAATSSGAAEKAGLTHSSGLSAGAKIGIGIGIPLVLLVAGSLIAIIWYQRRRLKLVEATTGVNAGGSAADDAVGKSEVTSDEVVSYYIPASYVDTRRAELKPQTHEMDGAQTQMAELPAEYK